ncbi:MAG: TraR/DksA family transcriptional regulator [Chitinophagales bacterium]|jgi:RNA polymerase-binding transcription factor DksA
MEEPKVRYSDTDLQEFKTLIEEKISKAQEELEFTRNQIAELSDTGFNQQNGDMYDDSGAHADLEFMTRMAARQVKFIEDLQKALLRIQNKTYGVCTVTGTLIPKERLRVVPHATKSVDGKNIANKNKITPGGDAEGESFPTEESARPAGKPVADQVRMAAPRAKSSDDWELDNETLEDAGYRNLPGEEEDH